MGENTKKYYEDLAQESAKDAAEELKRAGFDESEMTKDGEPKINEDEDDEDKEFKSLVAAEPKDEKVFRPLYGTGIKKRGKEFKPTFPENKHEHKFIPGITTSAAKIFDENEKKEKD